MTKKIAVYGYYGHSNAGDEAFQLVFNEVLKGHAVQYFSPSNLPRFSYQFDVLVLGGGNVMGAYFLRPLLELGWAQCQTKLALGVGLSDEFGLPLSQEIGFDQVLMRNTSEVAKAAHLSGVDFIPDLVFSAELPKHVDNIGIFDSIAPNYRKSKSIAFVISMEYFPEMARQDRQQAYLDFDKSISLLSKTIESLIPEYNIALFSISADPYHYDEISARLLYRACPSAWKNVVIVNTQGDPQKSMEGFRSFDCVLSMKFHGLVFALMCGAPIVNISRNIKNNDLMTLLGASDLAVDLLSPEVDVAAMRKVIDDSISRRMELNASVEKLRAEARATLSSKLGLLH